MLESFWRWMRRSRLGVVAATLLLVGGIGGIVFWGGFNTAMEATNRMEFCIGCHEMRDNVYAEYTQTIHYKNPAGVRAICSDCHVPKDWMHKVVRKVQATNELYHWALGTIDTKEKYEAKRLELARHVWAGMEANDSRECRNCHSFDAMDFHNQRPKAAETMQKAAKDGETCISCHKGIAHKLPDMTAGYKAMLTQLLAQGQKDAATADRLFALKTKPLFTSADASGDPAGRLFPATPVRVLARDKGLLKVQIEGWQQEQAERVIYQRFGQRIFAAALQPPLIGEVKLGQGKLDPDTDLTWAPATLEAWVTPDAVTADEAGLWAYGQEMFVSSCSTCHARPAPDHYLANQWIGTLKAMSRFMSLDKDDYGLLQTYLQLNAKDVTPHVGGS